MLVTCSGPNEKVAVQDIYKILNRFAEELVPELEAENEAEMLAKRAPEVDGKPLPKKQRAFQQLRMKAKAMLFIIMNESISSKLSAHQLAKVILDHIEDKKELLTRFCSRIYPIEYAVDATIENFEKCAAKLVEKHFPPLPQKEGRLPTWCLKFKCRSNNKFSKGMFQDILLKLMPTGYHFLQYKADSEFFVDITQHVMCISVLSPYSDDRYYSFQKCFEKPAEKPQDTLSKEEKLEADKDFSLDSKVDEEEEAKSDIDLF